MKKILFAILIVNSFQLLAEDQSILDKLALQKKRYNYATIAAFLAPRFNTPIPATSENVSTVQTGFGFVSSPFGGQPIPISRARRRQPRSSEILTQPSPTPAEESLAQKFQENLRNVEKEYFDLLREYFGI